MHILIVNNSQIPALKYGGTERVIWWLGKELVKLGHKVTFLVEKGSYCPFADVLFLKNDVPLENQIPENIDLVHLFFRHIGPLPKPSLTTFGGNATNLDVFDINTVFVSLNHANRHGSNAFVYNGLDFDDYGQVDFNKKRSYFHFLGNAAWRVKNVKGAINLALATKNKLHVLGGNRLNITMGFRFTPNPSISFHGMIGGEKKNEVLRGSKGLIFPVRWHEPFGIAITESLYFGCPVFGTPFGSLPELVPAQVGFLSNNFSELAESIQHVDDFNAKTCHEYVCDNFSAAKMTQDYLQLYEKVLQGQQLNPTQPRLLKIQEEKFLPFNY